MTVEQLFYLILSGVTTLLVMAITVIAYYIRRDTQEMKMDLREMRKDVLLLHDADSAIKAELAAHIATCAERHRHYPVLVAGGAHGS